jgi:branched-chain amino acid transport system ATP-binding protein
LAPSLLAVDRINAFYGDSHVLHDVSLALSPGRLLALLGRNGAGKSTCMHAVVGFLPPRSGRIRIAEREMQGATPEAICRHGVGFVPQGRRIFPTLTVRENLDVAARRGAPASGGKRWTREDVQAIFPRLKEREKQLAGSLSGGEQQMLAVGRALMTSPRLLLLDEPSEGLAPQIVRELGNVLAELKQQIFPRLKEREKQLAGSLSGGEQQMLAVGRALMTSPRVLLLDEPSEGLAPQIVRELGKVLADLKKEISILLVEQNLGLAMKLADDVVLLNTGRVVFSGTRDEFQQRQPELQRHLGVH